MWWLQGAAFPFLGKCVFGKKKCIILELSKILGVLQGALPLALENLVFVEFGRSKFSTLSKMLNATEIDMILPNFIVFSPNVVKNPMF